MTDELRCWRCGETRDLHVEFAEDTDLIDDPTEWCCDECEANFEIHGGEQL